MDYAEPDLTLQLPRDVYHQVIHTLRAALLPVTDAPEDLVHRDNAAIAMVASLLPANADEANLAAQYAAASAHAIECLRRAQDHRANLTIFLKCEAQADRMQRQARAFRALLLRVQAERRKRETDNAATDRAAWTEHCAIGLMADALGRAPLAAMAEPPPVPDPMQEAEPTAEPQADIAARPITMRPSIRDVPRSSVLWAAFRPSSTSGRRRLRWCTRSSPAPARSFRRSARRTITQ